MSYEANEFEVASVSALAGPERFDYFLRKVTDWEEVWSIGNDQGWALSADASGQEVVPVWPARAFAEACCVAQWAGYAPKAIELHTWNDKWIPGMNTDSRHVAVFPTPADRGVVVTPDELAGAINGALEEYE